MQLEGTDILIYAHQLLQHPQHWCQGAQARDALESPVLLFSPRATQWDIIGAIHFCYPSRQDRAEIKYRLAYHLRRQEIVPAGTIIGGLRTVTGILRGWNDSSTTMHHEILDTLEQLGI